MFGIRTVLAAKAADRVSELIKDILHKAAEKFSSYKAGQLVLRQFDRGLWVLEKSAQWALPHTAESNEKLTEELIRPLPWILFLPILLALRLFREFISQINLLRGEPPLRAGEVVSFIQSKRRYLRALKYQGTRTLRAKLTHNSLAQKGYQIISGIFNNSHLFQYCNGGTVEPQQDEKEGSGESNLSSPSLDDTRKIGELIEKMVDMYASSEDSNFTLSKIYNKHIGSANDLGSTNDDTLICDPTKIFSSTPRKQNNNDTSEDSTTILSISDIGSFTDNAKVTLTEMKPEKIIKMVNGKAQRKKNTAAEKIDGLKKVAEKSIPVLRISEVHQATNQEGSYSHQLKSNNSSTEKGPSTSTESVKPQSRNKKSKIKTPFWRRKNLNQTK